MQKLMVEEAGSRIFEMASSMGRMHERTLSGLADVTAKTPLGPIFAINASLVRMANDGIESLTCRISDVAKPEAPGAAQPVAKSRAAQKAEVPKAVAKQPAPLTAKTSPATAVAEVIEPDVADVIVEEIVAEAKAPAKAKKAAAKDDLTIINGIGATTAKKLNGAGIENFAQIAEMSEDKFAKLLASLEIKSIRFSPSQWIGEAKKHAA